MAAESTVEALIWCWRERGVVIFEEEKNRQRWAVLDRGQREAAARRMLALRPNAGFWLRQHGLISHETI